MGTSDLDELLRHAAVAQRTLKNRIAPGSQWANMSFSQGASTSPTDSEEAMVRQLSAPNEVEARRSMRIVTAGCCEGLLDFIDVVFDPGVKRRERIIEKAFF